MRYRSWIVSLVLVVAVVTAATVAGRHGQGTVLGRPLVRFGQAVRAPRLTAGLAGTNGWEAGIGTDTVAVYAGSERAHPADGLFVVVRRTAAARTVSRVVVPGSGAVTLLLPPTPAGESAALAETLRFVTANGGTGALALSSDRATLTP